MSECPNVCVYIGRNMYAIYFPLEPLEHHSSVLGCQVVYKVLGTHLGARYVHVPKE